MKATDLLNKITNEEMEEAIFYVNGDFFYDLIVIDKNLYIINTRTKQLELLETKYISRFIKDNVELIRLDNFEEIIKEEPRNIEVCGSLFTKSEYDKLAHSEEEKKIPEKIDYIVEKKEGRFGEYNDYYLPFEKANVGLCDVDKFIIDKINEIIDYLKSKGDE